MSEKLASKTEGSVALDQLKVFPATVEYAAKIVQLVNSAYRGEVSKQGWTTEADFLGGQRTDLEAILELIRKNDSVILLAVKGDDLVSSVLLERRGNAAYFGMFSVGPNLQSGGIGKFMITAAEEFVRKNWFSEKMIMTVITLRSELIAWYERRGYCRTGELVPFPYGDERFGIPKRNDLVMEVLSKDL